MLRRYTQEEHDFMVMYVPGHSHKEILEEFNKRFSPPVTLNKIKAYIKNHNLNTGRTGYFEKGHISHNKGKKMPEEVYEKVKLTMFKPGDKPKNTLPIGTELMLSDGYVWVKIDDQPKVPKKVNWKQKHRLVWEEVNGPVPEGCLVIFLDGDRTNFALENLHMVTKSQNARLNQYGFRGENPEATKLGITAVNLISATVSAEKKAKGGK